MDDVLYYNVVPMKINPRQLEKMAKKMGIQSTHIEADEVIIKTPDKEIVVHSPQVAKVNMMGEESFQISGTVHERVIEAKAAINEEDIETVMEQAGVSREIARDAIEANEDDLAAAILHLQEKKEE